MDRNHFTIDINLALSLGGGEWGCVKVKKKPVTWNHLQMTIFLTGSECKKLVINTVSHNRDAQLENTRP